jgi:uncharacterized protein RhaS with RHS repeats
MQGRIYDPTVGRFLTADPIVQSPFWSQGLNRYAYVFNSPMNLVDPSGFSAIGDYFQGLNDAPPEQAIPGYIGTGLVAGLAVMAVYEGVSASFAAGTASTVSTAATQSGGLGSAAPAARGAGAATVAIQRIKAATEDSVTREPGPVPTQSAERPIGAGKAHATSQPQKVSIDPDVGALACGGGGDVCLEILRQQRARILQENIEAIREGEWQLFWAYTGGQAAKVIRWGWGGYKAWRAAKAAEAAAKAARVLPQIAKASNREMLGQAISHVKGLSGTAAQKADLFQQLGGQITKLSGVAGPPLGE